LAPCNPPCNCVFSVVKDLIVSIPDFRLKSGDRSHINQPPDSSSTDNRPIFPGLLLCSRPYLPDCQLRWAAQDALSMYSSQRWLLPLPPANRKTGKGNQSSPNQQTFLECKRCCLF